MENIDLTRVLPNGTESMLIGGGILLLSVILAMVMVIKMRWKGRFMPFMCGVAAYVIFVFACVNLLVSAFAMIPSIDNAFTYNPQAYTIVYTLVATVGFLVARVVISKMIIERYETKGDVYMAGLGIGAGDCILYGMTAVSYYVWCIAINSEGGLAASFEGMAAEEIISTYESISILFDAPAILWLLMGVSAVMDMLIQFALMNITYGVVKEQLSKNWYSISAIIYFVSAVIFQMYDITSVVSIAVTFAIKLVIFAAAMYYTMRVAAKEIEYVED